MNVLTKAQLRSPVASGEHGLASGTGEVAGLSERERDGGSTV